MPQEDSPTGQETPPGPAQPNPPQAPMPSPGSARPAPPPWWMHPPRRRSTIGRICRWVGLAIFILSLLLNVYLLMVLGARMRRGFNTAVLRPGDSDQVVAVYAIEGIIDAGQATWFRGFCREVGDDEDVKAVLLRVNSPGGSVSASDQIHTMVKRLRDQGKKVVVSMGDVGASGGYYIAAPADEIIAEPTTLTGSIGVLANWIVLRGTLEQIGAEAMVIRSTHSRGWKDAMSFTRKPDDRQRKYLQEILDQLQDRFERVVRDGRKGKLPRDAVENRMLPVAGQVTVSQAGKSEKIESEPPDPFNGNVYLAERAKGLGLVDDIGYQDKAVDRAAALAGLSRPKVIQYARRHGLLTRLLGSPRPPAGFRIDRKLLDDLQTPRIMMLWKAD